MKTYSVCLKMIPRPGMNDNKPYWVTNWGEYFQSTDIDWKQVEAYQQKEPRCVGFGFMFGHNSRNLVSGRNRTVCFEEEDNG